MFAGGEIVADLQHKVIIISVKRNHAGDLMEKSTVVDGLWGSSPGSWNYRTHWLTRTAWL